MKRYILVAAATLLVATFAARANDNTVTQPCDTVLSVKNAEKVIITESASGVNVEVKGIESDPEFQTSCAIPYEKDGVIKTHQSFKMPMSMYLSRSKDFVGMIQGLHFGFVGAVDAPAEMNTQMGKSFEIGLDNIIFYGHCFGHNNRNMIQVGMGINWRNYRMTGMNRFNMEDGNVFISGYPEGADGKFSRIKAFSLSFPIAYTYYSPIKAIGKSRLGFKLAAILNWNSHASMLTQYELADGTKVKENFDKIGQRKFTVDVQLSVQVAHATALYIKYTPMDFFKSSVNAPKFQTISTGITLGF